MWRRDTDLDFERFVEWDQLELRVRGDRLQQIVTEFLHQKQSSVADFRMEFRDGELVVSATIRKVFSVPVSVTVETIDVVQRTLRIPLKKVATFGGVPIPKLLFQIIGSRGLPDGIRFDADTLTVTISIERFVPPFVDMTIVSIRIVRGGLEVRLGPGGADIAPVQPQQGHRSPPTKQTKV